MAKYRRELRNDGKPKSPWMILGRGKRARLVQKNGWRHGNLWRRRDYSAACLGPLRISEVMPDWRKLLMQRRALLGTD